MITALKLLQDAKAREWTFGVDQGDPRPLLTASASKAWQAVKDVGEAKVSFYDAGDKYLGWAYLMMPGPNTCADDESLVDYSSTGNAFELLCDELTNY